VDLSSLHAWLCLCVQCLFYTELPFAEDLRQFTFGSLPVEEMDAGSQPPNRKFTPTGEVHICCACAKLSKLMLESQCTGSCTSCPRSPVVDKLSMRLVGWFFTGCGLHFEFSSVLCFLWSPYVIGQTIIFSSCRFFFLFFFSSPNLSRHRLDVCHTSTHGVALVRI